MKKLVIIIMMVFAGFPLLAQSDIYLPPIVVAAGGSLDGGSDESTIIITRWRLSKIHVVTLSGDYSIEETGLVSDDPDLDWNVTLYPNPVSDNLHVEFELPETREFIIKLSDITGRVLMTREARTILPGEIIQFNLSEFSSALYMLHISTLDPKTHKVYRIQKI
jgi:hypothetical protein